MITVPVPVVQKSATVFYNNTGNKLNIEFVLLYICSADRYGTGGTNIPVL